MKKNFNYLLLLLFSITIISCGSDDDLNTGEPILKATINGESWQATSFEPAVLTQFTSTNEQAITLVGEANGIKLRVILTAEEISDCFNVGDYDFPNRVGISYQNTTGAFIGSHSYVDDANGDEIMTLKVTSCSGNKISGTFSGTYEGGVSGVSPVDVVIENGVFQNLEFTIVSF